MTPHWQGLSGQKKGGPNLVEGCPSIPAREIPKDGMLRTTWAGLPVTTVAPRFGGRRYYFLCPACDQRADKLYHVSRWACRRCHQLTYQSQHVSLSTNPLLRSLQLLDRADALVARYRAGDASVLGKLVKVRDQMLQELAQQQAEGSTQTGDIDPA